MKSNTKFNNTAESKSIVGKIKITVDGFLCERCGHKWIPKNKEYPTVCPNCKSPYWDRPRKK